MKHIGYNIIKVLIDIKKMAVDEIKSCDVTIQSGQFNRYGAIRKTNKLRKVVQLNSKRRIVLDTGFIHNSRSRSLKEGYLAVGFDGIKGMAKYYNKNSPIDRWKKLGITLADWDEDGKFVLVLGQALHGISTQDVNINNYLTKIMKRIVDMTDRKIIFKSHPNQAGKMPSGKFQINNESFKALRGKIKVCVSYSSNGSIDAILQGMPVITLNEMNMLYPYSCNELSETTIENPPLFDRVQPLSDLAYAQWSIDEIKSGETWSHIRQYV